jgi:hypothetical protein
MQRAVVDRLTAPFVRAEPAANAPAAADPARTWRDDDWFGQPSHRMLGEQGLQDFLVITFCAAFSLIGWLMIAQGVEQIRSTRAVMQWPTAEGVIEAIEVYPADGSQGARWRPHVIYLYAVGGRVITATRLSLGKAPLEAQRADAERYVSQYRPGSAVTVFFNPRELTESVLDVSPPHSVYVNLAFGATLALVGPALLILFGFWPRQDTAQPAQAAA